MKKLTILFAFIEKVFLYFIWALVFAAMTPIMCLLYYWFGGKKEIGISLKQTLSGVFKDTYKDIVTNKLN